MLKVSPFSVTSALGDDLTCYLGPWGEIISQIMYLIISICRYVCLRMAEGGMR